MDRVNVFVRWGVTILIVLVGLYVALSPSLIYAPVPKVILFCLVSFLPAILFGTEATSQFKLSLPGFVFATTGAAAVALGTLLLLSNLAKPEQQIAVYRIVDEHRQPVLGLDRDGAIQVHLSNQGLAVTKFLDGNSMILIFPEQVGECDILVKPLISGPTYSGKVTYAGNRQSELLLGKDLTANR
jgi:hypothetical protein